MQHKKPTFDLEIDKIISRLEEIGAKTVIIQAADGLKPLLPPLLERIKSRGIKYYISADPCYGGCDIAENEAEKLNVDAIIHIGHSPMVKVKKPVIYIDAKAQLYLEPLLEEALHLLHPYEKIGLTFTIHHVHQLNAVKSTLEEYGKTVYIGKSSALPYVGQVIGCDYSAAIQIADKAEAFLHIGGGIFHPKGLALSVGKPVISLNPYSGKITNISAEDYLRQRWWSIKVAEEKSIFGIIIGTRIGQMHVKKAEKVRRLLEKQGKEVHQLLMREINAVQLLNLPWIEAFIIAACPRIPIDGFQQFYEISKPALTLNEAIVMLEGSWNGKYPPIG